MKILTIEKKEILGSVSKMKILDNGSYICTIRSSLRKYSNQDELIYSKELKENSSNFKGVYYCEYDNVNDFVLVAYKGYFGVYKGETGELLFYNLFPLYIKQIVAEKDCIYIYLSNNVIKKYSLDFVEIGSFDISSLINSNCGVVYCDGKFYINQGCDFIYVFEFGNIIPLFSKEISFSYFAVGKKVVLNDGKKIIVLDLELNLVFEKDCIFEGSDENVFIFENILGIFSDIGEVCSCSLSGSNYKYERLGESYLSGSYSGDFLMITYTLYEYSLVKYMYYKEVSVFGNFVFNDIGINVENGENKITLENFERLGVKDENGNIKIKVLESKLNNINRFIRNS